MRIEGIQPGTPIEMPEFIKKGVVTNQVPTFKETLATFVNDVNTAQKVASDAQIKFLSGEVTDVHQVMAKSEEANTSFNMLMELRNKSVEGLQEMLRTKL